MAPSALPPFGLISVLFAVRKETNVPLHMFCHLVMGFARRSSRYSFHLPLSVLALSLWIKANVMEWMLMLLRLFESMMQRNRVDVATSA